MRSRLVCVLLLWPSLASGQGVTVDDVRVEDLPADVDHDPVTQVVVVREESPADVLRDVRLDNLRQRRGEGWTLLLGGALATIGGGVVAIARRDDEGWLAGGVTTLSFGVINALLGFGLLDLSGSRRRAIIDGRHGIRTQYGDVREAEMLDQRRTALVYGVNFGLDVAYIVAGALMWALGAAYEPDKPWLVGAGVGMLSQGAFLLAFDLAGMVRASGRAEAVRALPR